MKATKRKMKRTNKRGRYDNSSDSNKSNKSNNANDKSPSSKKNPKYQKSIPNEEEYIEENIEKMREESRHIYLKIREELTLLEQSIQDEEALFNFFRYGSILNLNCPFF